MRHFERFYFQMQEKKGGLILSAALDRAYSRLAYAPAPTGAGGSA